jgi:hypothetical protein
MSWVLWKAPPMWRRTILESWTISRRKVQLMKVVEKRAGRKWVLLTIRRPSWMERQMN